MTLGWLERSRSEDRLRRRYEEVRRGVLFEQVIDGMRKIFADSGLEHNELLRREITLAGGTKRLMELGNIRDGDGLKIGLRISGGELFFPGGYKPHEIMYVIGHTSDESRIDIRVPDGEGEYDTYALHQSADIFWEAMRDLNDQLGFLQVSFSRSQE